MLIPTIVDILTQNMTWLKFTEQKIPYLLVYLYNVKQITNIYLKYNIFHTFSPLAPSPPPDPILDPGSPLGP